MPDPQTTTLGTPEPTDPIELLKFEFRKVIKCGFPIPGTGGSMRFSFCVSPESFAKWKELADVR